MKINEALNLVIPLESNGVTYHVHSTPLSAGSWDEHFLLIAATFNEIVGRGMSTLAGPRIASKLMRKLAEAEGNLPAADGLMNEIKRTTMVLAPDGPMLLHNAVKDGIIDPVDLDILENALVFFIVVSAMHRPAMRRQVMETVVALWTGQMTSLSYTDFAASLRTSTVVENTGAKAAGSSVPS